jgi:diguanylate cyclase (GGDEF)-like protein
VTRKNNNDIALLLLESLDIAALRRTGPRQYKFFGNAPKFYRELFPAEDGGPSSEPWHTSPMLEFFLDDAERFFKKGKDGSISSGVWQEDGKVEHDAALAALAVAFEGVQIIVVRMLYDDYIEKSRILRKAREQLIERRSMAQSLKTFKTRARIDDLTKVYNRATFNELLGSEIRRSQALDYPLSILFLDIDNFKKINDTFGHPVGDVVLRNLASLLVKTLRRNDIVARYGGEEFVVLLPHEPPERAYTIGEKVRQRVAAMTHPGMPPATVSMGCTTYIAPETADNFIQRADLALYDAKGNGKNIVRVR